jgi:phosphate-selective porin OprO/OprP
MFWVTATSIAQWLSAGARRALPAVIVGMAIAAPASADPATGGGTPTTAPGTVNTVAAYPSTSAPAAQRVAYNQPQPAGQPVGYLSPEFESRLQELQQTVARQQSQIQAQQTQLQTLQQQAGRGTFSTVSQNIPGAVNDLYPGGAAPALGGGMGGPASGFGGVPGADTALPESDIYPGSAAPLPSILRSTSPYVIGSDRGLVGAWTNNGPVFASRNGDFTFHPRFMDQTDLVAMRNPASNIGVPGGGGTADSVEFRRLRIGVDGSMWEWIDYVLEMDLAMALENLDPAGGTNPINGLRSGGTVGGVPQNQAGTGAGTIQPTDVFLTFKGVPLLGFVRVGNQPDWIGFEHIESSRFLDFMERSPLQDAFNGPNNNGYQQGVSTFRNYFRDSAGAEFGVYKNNVYDSGFTYDLGNTNYTYNGRVFWTPYYDEASNGRYVVHVGCGGEFRTFNTTPFGSQDGTNVRVRSRGEIRTTASALDPNFADTGNFYATGQGLINPELAINWGSLLIQAEFESSYFTNAAAQKGGTGLGNVNFRGGYVQALYFLTGEHRQYQRLSGVFGRTIPNSSAYWVRGAGFSKGAWQVGARYDWLDLNSGLVTGGQEQDMTLGVNWFLNPNTILMFNYVGSWVNNSVAATLPGTVFSLNGSRFTGEGYIQTVGARMNFNF